MKEIENKKLFFFLNKINTNSAFRITSLQLFSSIKKSLQFYCYLNNYNEI